MSKSPNQRSQANAVEARRLRTAVAAWAANAAERMSTEYVRRHAAEDATFALIAELVMHRYPFAETIDLLEVDGRMEILQVHDCAYEALIGLEDAQPGVLDDTSWWALLLQLVHSLPTTHPRYMTWGPDEPYTGAPLIDVPSLPRPVLVDLTVQ